MPFFIELVSDNLMHACHPYYHLLNPLIILPPIYLQNRYKRYDRDLKAIEKLVVLCDTRDKEQSSLQELERRGVEVEEKRAEIETLRQQLQALGINTDGSQYGSQM